MIELIYWIGLGLIVFLLGRELFCWYNKQNEIVALLKDIKSVIKGEI